MKVVLKDESGFLKDESGSHPTLRPWIINVTVMAASASIKNH